jgi:hypothetical protein
MSDQPKPTTNETVTTVYPATCNVFARAQDGTTTTMTVIAEPSDTPGLMVTPQMYGNRLTGFWQVTHAASGYMIPTGWDGDIQTARQVADALGATPVDWTADTEAVQAQVVEHADAVNEARRIGQYPGAMVDGEWDGKPATGVAPYPGTEAQATADAIARHVTRALQYRCREGWDLIKRDDKDGRAIYDHHMHALVAEWALTLVLREFAKVDQQAADWTARQVWFGWQSGDATHEDVYTWAAEYNLPALPEGDETDPAKPEGNADV